MRSLDPVALTTGAGQTVALDPGTIGVLIGNESPYAVSVFLGGNSRWLPAWTLDYFSIPTMLQANGQITLTSKSISSATNAPSADALITMLTQGDKLEGQYPCALTRQTNIGNGVVPTSQTNSLINDGSTPNTVIIESTPSDQSTSAISIDNEGNVTIRTKDAGVWSVIMSIIAGVGSGAATKLFHGTADNVPATGVTSGALPAGVTVAANAVRSGALQAGVTVAPSQLTSGDLPAGTTVPTANIDSGALPAGVTIPGSQVTGDLAVGQVGPGALDTDVTLGAAQLTTGIAPTGVEVGTDSTHKFSMHDLGGYTGTNGIIMKGESVWMCSDTNVGLLYNSYFDGTNYKFLSTGDYAAQILISLDAYGGTVPHFQIRYSSTTGTAGATITWNSWQGFPTMIDNSGLGGVHIFTGTTTPSGQVAGDLWFDW